MTRLSGKALKILVSISISLVSFLPAKAFESYGGSNSESQNQIPKLQSVFINPGEILLHWTAPGDDHNTEPASGYDVRYVLASAGPIDNEGQWQQATQCQGEPMPSAIGRPDSMLITGLTPGESYYFGIKSYDEANNCSIISNSPLVVAAGNPDSVILGDVNNSGVVNGLDVVYLVNYLKGGLPIPNPPLRADVNGTCEVDGMDVLYLRDYLGGGPVFIQGNCGPAVVARIIPAKLTSNETLHPGQKFDRK